MRRVSGEWESQRDRKNRELAECACRFLRVAAPSSLTITHSLRQALDERDAAVAAAQAWASEAESTAAVRPPPRCRLVSS
jgi:hypothetical protein